MTRPSAPGGNVDATVDGGLPPLIPEGPYQVRLLDWATVNLFGRRPKLVLYLAVCDQGEHFETRLECWYNVKTRVGPARRKGRFKLGRRSYVLAGEVDAWIADLVAGRHPGKAP